MDKSTQARFWAKVDIRELEPGACWEWVAARLASGGYGAFRVAGKTLRAHRLAFEACVGPIPEGLVVRHRCDNPACVNPAHLEVGTHAENMADMYARGRAVHHRGDAHPARQKTHCARGHRFTEANTRWDRNGWRHCRACRKLEGH